MTRGTGKKPVFHLFELRGGKVWRVRGYLNEDEALEAAGLSTYFKR